MIVSAKIENHVTWEGFAPLPHSEDSEVMQALSEDIGPNHLARLIDAQVDSFDMGKLVASYSFRGSAPTRPDPMIKAALFEIQSGNTSPSQWHLHSKESIPVKWLLRGLRPSRSAWYNLYDRIVSCLDEWNQGLLEDAIDQGVIDPTDGALDGTTVEASASRHHLLNLSQVEKRFSILLQAIELDTQGTELSDPPYWLAHTDVGRLAQKNVTAKRGRFLKPST